VHVVAEVHYKHYLGQLLHLLSFMSVSFKKVPFKHEVHELKSVFKHESQPLKHCEQLPLAKAANPKLHLLQTVEL
jgi:hypothetical protein